MLYFSHADQWHLEVRRMSTNPEPDPTTETDDALLERAARAELSPAPLTQRPGASEHPSGQAAAADLEPDSGYAGPTTRREPKSH
jgi:hypothetical protein